MLSLAFYLNKLKITTLFLSSIHLDSTHFLKLIGKVISDPVSYGRSWKIGFYRQPGIPSIPSCEWIKNWSVFLVCFMEKSLLSVPWNLSFFNSIWIGRLIEPWAGLNSHFFLFLLFCSKVVLGSSLPVPKHFSTITWRPSVFWETTAVLKAQFYHYNFAAIQCSEFRISTFRFKTKLLERIFIHFQASWVTKELIYID